MKMPTYLSMLLLLVLVPAGSAQSPQPTGSQYDRTPLPAPLPALPAAKCVQKVYSVADLVIPIDSNHPACAATGCAAPTQLQDPSVYAKQLIKQMMMLSPQSWECNGGCGKADYYPIGHALVVCQTADVQERIAALLDSLRKLQDTQVVVEIRFVGVSPALLEAAGADLPAPEVAQLIRQVDVSGLKSVGVECNQPAPMPKKTCIWNDEQLRMFLQAAQGDRHTNIMQAPRITVLNGQTAHLDISETKFFVTGVKIEECKGQLIFIPDNKPHFIGMRCEVQAVVKENGKAVGLRFKTTLAEESGPAELLPISTTITPVMANGAKGSPVPFTQNLQKPRIQTVEVDRMATVPVNGTLVMPAGTFLKEERVECSAPGLRKIPYVNRLFRNVSYTRATQDIVVLVTPRIVVQPAAEAKEVKTGSCLTGVGCNSASGMTGTVCAQPCPQSAAQYCPLFGATTGKPNCIGFVDSGTVASMPCCSAKAPAMNLADIVALSSSNVSDEVINNQITTTGVRFTLSTEDILWLKKNKVSDSVVCKMQGTRPQPWSDPAPMPPTLVTPMPMPAPVYVPQPPAPAQYFPLPMMPPAPAQYSPAPMPIPYLKPVQAVPPTLPTVPPLRGNHLLPAPRANNTSADKELFQFWLEFFSESAPVPIGPRPISLDSGFPVASSRNCPLPCQTTEESKPSGSFMIGRGVNSDAGAIGSFIVDERNFDVKRATSQQAGEIGEQLVGATVELVSGVAGFVGEELPAILSDAGEAVRPKVKLTVEFKMERK